MGVVEAQRVRRGSLFEFPAKVSENGRVTLPPDVAEAVQPGQVVRVFLVVHSEHLNEDELWGVFGAHQLVMREE